MQHSVEEVVAIQNSSPRAVLKRMVLKLFSKFTRTPLSRSALNNFAKWLYSKHVLPLVLSCNFSGYFQNTFLWEHLLGLISDVFKPAENKYMNVSCCFFIVRCFSESWLDGISILIKWSCPLPLAPLATPFNFWIMLSRILCLLHLVSS